MHRDPLAPMAMGADRQPRIIAVVTWGNCAALGRIRTKAKDGPDCASYRGIGP